MSVKLKALSGFVTGLVSRFLKCCGEKVLICFKLPSGKAVLLEFSRLFALFIGRTLLSNNIQSICFGNLFFLPFLESFVLKFLARMF
jgi:hypothetical protein